MSRKIAAQRGQNITSARLATAVRVLVIRSKAKSFQLKLSLTSQKNFVPSEFALLTKNLRLWWYVISHILALCLGSINLMCDTSILLNMINVMISFA